MLLMNIVLLFHLCWHQVQLKKSASVIHIEPSMVHTYTHNHTCRHTSSPFSPGIILHHLHWINSTNTAWALALWFIASFHTVQIIPQQFNIVPEAWALSFSSSPQTSEECPHCVFSLRIPHYLSFHDTIWVKILHQSFSCRIDSRAVILPHRTVVGSVASAFFLFLSAPLSHG